MVDGSLYLLAPEAFDRTHPNYTPLAGSKAVSVLPAGTEIRIDKLWKDHGNWGGLRITGQVNEGTSVKSLEISWRFFMKDKFLNPGLNYPSTWAVDPDLLEK